MSSENSNETFQAPDYEKSSPVGEPSWYFIDKIRRDILKACLLPFSNILRGVEGYDATPYRRVGDYCHSFWQWYHLIEQNNLSGLSDPRRTMAGTTNSPIVRISHLLDNKACKRREGDVPPEPPFCSFNSRVADIRKSEAIWPSLSQIYYYL